MASLRNKIKNWLDRNHDYLEQNANRFRLISDLHPDASEGLFNKYKKRITVLKAMDKKIEKVKLFEKADEFGYKGSFNSSKLTMERFIKKKESEAEDALEEQILFDIQENRKKKQQEKQENENKLKLELEERQRKKAEEIRNSEYNGFITFLEPEVKDVFNNRLLYIDYKTDIDEAIASGSIEAYYEAESKREGSKNRTKIVQENISFITRKVKEKVDDSINRLSYKERKDGYQIYTICIMKGFNTVADSDRMFSCKAIKTTNVHPITEEMIKDNLDTVNTRTLDTDGYLCYLFEIKVILSKLDNEGGCCKDEKTSIIQKSKKDGLCIKRVSPKSTNDNCLIACFNKFYGVKGNELKPTTVRKECKIPELGMIDMKYIPTLSDYYNNYTKTTKGYILLDPSLNLRTSSYELDESIPLFNLIINDEFDIEDQIILQLEANHYYLIHMEFKETMKKCDKCNTKWKNKHTCNINKESYYQTHQLKKKNMVKVQKLKKQDKIESDEIVFWDLETFQPNNVQTPYASGYTLNDKYTVHYGKSAMEKTVDYFLSLENKKISAFNGSGFDYYFLMNQLIARGASISGMIMTGGKLMKFKWTYEERTNSVFDLYLFLNCSLAKACESFKTETQKGSFDHKLIKSWEDVEKHKSEVLPYLQSDVNGLKQVYHKFNTVIYDEFGVNVCNYVTVSNLSYEIWSSMLNYKVEVPNDMERYKFIRQTIYGGRVYPLQSEFVSKNYLEVTEGLMSHDEFMKDGDFIFNADATSLYPASMAGNDLMKVKYPTGNSRWSEKPSFEWSTNKMGFYNIRFSPPKDIRHPILPRKTKGGGVEWSLLDGEGVYNSVDIQNAFDNGYKIEFHGKCLVYDDTADVFQKYITTIFKKKETAEREKNEVQRQVWKLFQNSLYGKTLQKAIFDKTEIINDIAGFYKFSRDFIINDFHILDNDKVLLTGESKDEIQATKITKPCQLGSFVTAYSRRLMLHFMKAVDPTLKSQIFTYTDTDSLHLKSYAYKILVEKGLILPKSQSKLGYLCSDISGEGIIFYERNMGPKSYLYDYINNQNEFGSSMKTKGIPSRLLKKEYFELDNQPVVVMNGLRKVNKKISHADKENDVSHFNIVNHTMTRTFHKNEWTGMDYFDGEYYPKGYVFNQDSV